MTIEKETMDPEVLDQIREQMHVEERYHERAFPKELELSVMRDVGEQATILTGQLMAQTDQEGEEPMASGGFARRHTETGASVEVVIRVRRGDAPQTGAAADGNQ